MARSYQIALYMFFARAVSEWAQPGRKQNGTLCASSLSLDGRSTRAPATECADAEMVSVIRIVLATCTLSWKVRSFVSRRRLGGRLG